MKEILALHEKILALPEDARPGGGVNFSRAPEENDGVEELPPELQDEVAALREAINATLPEDFDYFAFLHVPDGEPAFDLLLEQMPVNGPENDLEFQPERSLVEQLRELNWEELRETARKNQETIESIEHLTQLMTEPLRPAKALQRDYREETKEFVRDSRKDDSKIHVLYLDEEKGPMKVAFDDGDKLRDVLPAMIAQRSEVFAVVAWGKPLPVERVDALNAQAQQALRDKIKSSMDEAAKEVEAEEAATASGAAASDSGVDEQVDAVRQQVGHLPDDVAAQQADQPETARRTEQQA